FSFMVITALDIDTLHIDKSLQVTLNALDESSSVTRECARKLGKENFYIVGEFTDGDTFGSI
ncbi:hypothetical protein BT96DRAFT_775569, partial [Gymnopus androsaceus JB14]